MAKYKPLPEFDFSRPTQWTAWHKRFVHYSVAAKLGAEESNVQVSILVYVRNEQAETIFKSFTLIDAQKKYLNHVLGCLDSHFIPKRNAMHELSLFYQQN